MDEIKTRIRMATEFMRFVHPAGTITEFRGLGTRDNKKLTVSGRFDNPENLARNAIHTQEKGYVDNCYFTVNAVKPTATHIGYPTINKMDVNCRTTGDRDVLHRTLYVIDVDSVHPKDVCATDTERAAAFAVADKIEKFLRERGWPEAVRVDSGNGLHLYYMGDNTNPSSPVWTHVLRGLSQRFSTPEAKVDTSVGNAGRIMRLPFTLNKKGPNTPERPHRLCRVISYPENWEPVGHAKVAYKLATEFGFDADQDRRRKAIDSDRPLLVENAEEAVLDYIKENPEVLRHTHTFIRNGRRCFALAECPFAGRRHSGGPEKTCITLSDHAVGFKCLSAACEHKTFKDLKNLVQKHTGRVSRIKFYGPSPEQLAERELKDMMERMQHNVQFRTDIAYDQETWDQAEHVTTTDPTEYGLDFTKLKDEFWIWAIRKERDLTGDETEQHTRGVCSAIDAEDLQAIGGLMGAYDLFWAYREVHRPQMKLSEATRARLARWEKEDEEAREDDVLTVLEAKRFIDEWVAA